MGQKNYRGAQSRPTSKKLSQKLWRIFRIFFHTRVRSAIGKWFHFRIFPHFPTFPHFWKNCWTHSLTRKKFYCIFKLSVQKQLKMNLVDFSKSYKFWEIFGKKWKMSNFQKKVELYISSYGKLHSKHDGVIYFALPALVREKSRSQIFHFFLNFALSRYIRNDVILRNS